MWYAEIQMRNTSEILRNAGGLGESISQNSLRVLPDFLAGFWRGGLKVRNKKLIAFFNQKCYSLWVGTFNNL